jgi:DNA-binding transcriptional ArsR family regulator
MAQPDPSTAAIPDSCDAPDLSEIDLVTVLQALADPVRLEIVRQLAECRDGDGLSCGQIEVPVTKSTASHHLKSLACAGITAEREDGRRKFVRLRRSELEARFPGLVEMLLRAA